MDKLKENLHMVTSCIKVFLQNAYNLKYNPTPELYANTTLFTSIRFCTIYLPGLANEHYVDCKCNPKHQTNHASLHFSCITKNA